MVLMLRENIERIVPDDMVNKLRAEGYIALDAVSVDEAVPEPAPSADPEEEPEETENPAEAEAEPGPACTEDDLIKKTVKELKIIAKDLGIANAVNMNKETLVQVILAVQ